jgi:GNAT superfamily N-acetyltransferase
MHFDIRLGSVHEIATLVSVDDDAADLYATAGIVFDPATIAQFVEEEQARWRRALELERVFVAVSDGAIVGFAAMDLLDGALPYLEQLSVRMNAMRCGIGGRLVGEAIAWAKNEGDGLWLTTYGHLSWNRPFYERHGFHLVPEAEWGPDIRHHNEEERRSLPRPEERVVMRRANG